MDHPFPMTLPRHWPRFVQQGLLHALGLQRLLLASVRAGFENSPDPRSRLASGLDRLHELLSLRDEEIRIKDARLRAIPPRHRPYYPPSERLAILLLRARAGWNASDTARRFLLAPATLAAWMKRLDEGGPTALVQVREPVNRFPEFVAALVQRLHAAAPASGRRRLAQILARLGLHLAPSTVERLRKKPLRPAPVDRNAGRIPEVSPLPDSPRRVTAKHSHHLWHVDLTTLPTGFGLWVPWWPYSLPLRWFFSWHVALILDHFTRTFVAFAVFRQEPTSSRMCAFLDRAIAKAGTAPRHMVSDQGVQFGKEYREWCRKRGVKPRFGALGKHGSIALIERFIRSLKDECLRVVLVPFNVLQMEAELGAYALWYNAFRPHAALKGATPMEALQAQVPACQGPRLEPRPRYPLPRGDPKARRVGRLQLQVSFVDGRRHLPVFALREAA